MGPDRRTVLRFVRFFLVQKKAHMLRHCSSFPQKPKLLWEEGEPGLKASFCLYKAKQANLTVVRRGIWAINSWQNHTNFCVFAALSITSKRRTSRRFRQGSALAFLCEKTPGLPDHNAAERRQGNQIGKRHQTVEHICDVPNQRDCHIRADQNRKQIDPPVY